MQRYEEFRIVGAGCEETLNCERQLVEQASYERVPMCPCRAKLALRKGSLEDAVVQYLPCSSVLIALEHRGRIPGHFVHLHYHVGQEQIAPDVVQI